VVGFFDVTGLETQRDMTDRYYTRAFGCARSLVAPGTACTFAEFAEQGRNPPRSKLVTSSLVAGRLGETQRDMVIEWSRRQRASK
jgi:hypothetical protein